jgi:hypothetical protein
VKRRNLGWPAYLALTFGIVAAVDLLFDMFGFGRSSLGWIVSFSMVLILIDILTGAAPSQQEENR